MKHIETAIQLYSYCTTLPLQTNMSLWGAIASAPAAQAAASEPESTSAAFFFTQKPVDSNESNRDLPAPSKGCQLNPKGWLIDIL